MIPFPRLSRPLDIVAPLAVGIAALLSALAIVSAQTAPKINFETGHLAIVTSNGEHRFNIELARTNDQQMLGLMYRQKLAPDSGMLFIYDRPRTISMWMKNTLIPLDMIFIGADGRVVGVAQRTVPLSLEPIYSPAPALAVLEVNGGTAVRLSLRPGDRIVYEAFGTSG